MEENLSSPVTDQFPDLSGFMAIVQGDGTYLLGAGVLADGLIVPLFPDEQGAKDAVMSLSDDPEHLDLRVCPLGEPFKAMRKAAGEGAAGFQFSSGLFTDKQREKVFKQTAGRILFPFMTRREEAGGQWPTVLGSALQCESGIYLTRRGHAHFGPHDLCQWVRWDVMDRASARLGIEQPLRSHNPGEPFWCLSHAEGEVRYKEASEWYSSGTPAIVLFARDTALRQFMPPEGYYPVFPSEHAAREFLERRLGGAFHIILLAESSTPNLIRHQGLMAQDLGKGSALGAIPKRIDDLPRHLKAVRDTFRLPPYASFVLNPVGHREDVAWGSFSDIDEDALVLKSVGRRWKLLSDHQYSALDGIDQFDGQDTFFLGPSEFRFAELRRTLGHFTPVLGDDDLRSLTDTEAEEAIRDFVVRAADNPLTKDVMGKIPPDIEVEAPEGENVPDVEGAEAHALAAAKVDAPLLDRWVLSCWDTVDGEPLGPFYFDTPFHLARALCHLELEDRPARVTGQHGHSSIGFEGSRNQDLEDAGGAGLATALVRICQRMFGRGYRPSDAWDMAAVANAVLKSVRVSLCSNAADALMSHIPNEARPSDRLMQALGFPAEFREPLIELIEAQVDPEGDELLRRRVGDEIAVHLAARTRLFLTTALIQFDSLGKSPCIDYAPVSVQVVKALEFEMRELAAVAVRGFTLAPGHQPSREEETLFNVLENRREMVSLGSITHAFKAARKASTGILWYAADQLRKLEVLDLTEPRIVRLILNDVLKRFRNGGAHEQAINYSTCLECIDALMGTRDQPGLILHVSRWRRQQVA